MKYIYDEKYEIKSYGDILVNDSTHDIIYDFQGIVETEEFNDFEDNNVYIAFNKNLKKPILGVIIVQTIEEIKEIKYLYIKEKYKGYNDDDGIGSKLLSFVRNLFEEIYAKCYTSDYLFKILQNSGGERVSVVHDDYDNTYFVTYLFKNKRVFKSTKTMSSDDSSDEE